MALFSSIFLLNDLANELAQFEANMRQLADDLALNVAHYQIDHVSLRCHELNLAEQWREGLSQCGHCFSDKVINGRPIYLFKLETPLIILGQRVYIVELPYPTDKQYEYQGWEHIEQVIAVDPNHLVEEVMSILPTPLPTHYYLKISEPKGDNERLPNPTVAISNGKVTLKYHPYSLVDVVESER